MGPPRATSRGVGQSATLVMAECAGLQQGVRMGSHALLTDDKPELLELELESELEHAGRDNFLDPSEIRSAEARRVEGGLVGEAARDRAVAGCYGRLPGVRVDQVVQLGDD